MVDTAPWAGDGTVLVNTAYTQLWPLPGTGQLRRERERLYSLSPGLGMFGVWRPGRVSGPSTASAGLAGDTRLLRGWGWPGPGWPAVSTTVACEISSEQLSAGPCDQYYPILRAQETGVNM